MKKMVKTYFKILAVTAGVQFAGLLLLRLTDAMLSGGGSTIFPFWVLAACILVSTVLGIVLPLRWCNSRGQKVATVLLLPTNYTWIVIAIAVVKFVRDILQILGGIPDNFG